MILSSYYFKLCSSQKTDLFWHQHQHGRPCPYLLVSHSYTTLAYSRLRSAWQWTISIVTSIVEAAFQWYLWILNIIAVASVIVFSIPVIALGLIVFLFTDPLPCFESICADPPAPTPPIATSSTNNCVEEVPQTYTEPPFADESFKIYTLPNTLRFIASPLDIDDVSTPLHIGQLSEFVRLIDSAGSILWVGLSSYQSCSSLSSDENPDVRLGSRVYEVTIGQSVKQDGATSRVEVAPTGRVPGEVIGIYVDNVTVLLKMEDWFTESGTFEMGRWRVVVNEPVQAGDVQQRRRSH